MEIKAITDSIKRVSIYYQNGKIIITFLNITIYKITKMETVNKLFPKWK